MWVRALVIGAVIWLVGATPAAAEVHVTSSANSGAGSLRDVIAAAPVGETVVIDAGVDPVLNSEIAIDKSLTIRGQGAGSTRIGINGVAQTRVLKIGEATPGISVAIEALEIAGGRGPTGSPGNFSPPGPGGQGANGGAILNKANRLQLVGVVLSDNRAGIGGIGGFGGADPNGGNGGAGGDGGAIWNSGGLTVVDSTLTGNKAGAGGMGSPGSITSGSPGFGGGGGAIFNSGVLAIVDSTLVQNEAGAGNAGTPSTFPAPGSGGGGGGAIRNLGTLTISGSTLSRNVAGAGGAGGISAGSGGTGGFGGSGGAILVEGTGTADVANSTFAGNVAGAGGPGAVSGSVPSNGGTGGQGGAVAAPAGTVHLAAVTVKGNAVGQGGAGNGTGIPGASGSGGGISGAVTVRASIVALNDGNGNANCSGPVVDGGGNLAFPEAGGCTGFAVADPKLDPAGLASNGGPTQTIALLPGSAALDLVPAAACLTATGDPLTVDQRGVARFAGPCDAGAYEVERPAPEPPSSSPTGPPTSQSPFPPPDTTLTKKPGRRVVTRKKRATVVVRFGSGQAGAGFQCRLDKGRFEACKSPKAYSLKPGPHTIAVRAVLPGAVDPTPAETSFKVVKAKKHKPKRRPKPKHNR